MGPHYQIAPYVTNDGVYNTWRVTSEFGVWDVQGDERVAELLREIAAIARLREESKGTLREGAGSDGKGETARRGAGVHGPGAHGEGGAGGGVAFYEEDLAYGGA